MKKLIITDIDGTILSNGEVSEATKQTVQALQEAGHYYTLATGRHFVAVEQLAKDLNVDVPVICANGAHIVNLKDKSIIREMTLPEETVANLHQICNKHNLSYILYCTKYIMGEQKLVNLISGILNVNISTRIVTRDELNLRTSSVLKVLIIENDETVRTSVRKDLSKISGINVAASNKALLDITVLGSDKGTAIIDLANHLDIPIEDVIAFGDQENDLQMLSTAGTGVAMGNAVPLIKEAIKTHTDTVSNDGFTKYIKENIL